MEGGACVGCLPRLPSLGCLPRFPSIGCLPRFPSPHAPLFRTLSLSLSDTHLSEEEKYVTQKMEAFRGEECHGRSHPRHYLPPQCVCMCVCVCARARAEAWHEGSGKGADVEKGLRLVAYEVLDSLLIRFMTTLLMRWMMTER